MEAQAALAVTAQEAATSSMNGPALVVMQVHLNQPMHPNSKTMPPRGRLIRQSKDLHSAREASQVPLRMTRWLMCV